MTDLAAIRYELIAPLLRRYLRRFTLLDLGAGINPYMSQRIGNDFDAVVVLAEKDELCPGEVEKLGPRSLWLRKSMSAEDLAKLTCCENFDLALALNIAHHFGNEWKDILYCITAMAPWTVVQTPSIDDMQTCGQEVTPKIHAFIEKHGSSLGESVQFEGHLPRPIALMGMPGPRQLTMSSWTSPEYCIDAEIVGDFRYKTIELRHKPLTPRRYIHGMNLWNFVQLGGAWPRKDTVLRLIREFPLPKEHHGDITAHNFIFDGAELHLIDGHEGWEFDDAAGMKKTEEMVGDLLI